MFAVIIVGDWALIIKGTDKTDIMVTKLSINPTSSVWRTCGRTISMRMRSRPAPRLRAGFNRAAIDGCHGTCQWQGDEWRLFPDECNDDATPVEKAHCLQWGLGPSFNEQAVHQPVWLGRCEVSDQPR